MDMVFEDIFSEAVTMPGQKQHGSQEEIQALKT
jgi:hypothetical protein